MSSRTSTTPETGAALRRVIEQPVFVPVRGGDVTAEAVARRGQAIGMGLLRPGDRLPPEAQLARDLGISPASLCVTILRNAAPRRSPPADHRHPARPSPGAGP